VSDVSDRAGSGGDLRLLLSVVPDPEVDPESAERAARRLRSELADLEADVATAPVGTAPEGAKGIDLGSVSAMVVAVSSSGALVAVIDLVRDWLGRQSAVHRISVTIDGDTIELDRVAPDEKRRLVDAYLERHSAG
jgi:hypothetical protein